MIEIELFRIVATISSVGTTAVDALSVIQSLLNAMYQQQVEISDEWATEARVFDSILHLMRMADAEYISAAPKSDYHNAIQNLRHQMVQIMISSTFMSTENVRYLDIDNFDFLVQLFARDESKLKLQLLSLLQAILGTPVSFGIIEPSTIFTFRSGLYDIFCDRMTPETDPLLLYSTMNLLLSDEMIIPTWIAEDPKRSDETSVGQFHAFYMRRISIEIKMQLDELETLLVDMDREGPYSCDEDSKIDETLCLTMILFQVVEKTIILLPDLETFGKEAAEAGKIALSLQKSVYELMDLIMEFLTLVEGFVQSHQYKARYDQVHTALSTLVNGCRGILSTWMHEEMVENDAKVLDLLPFLITFDVEPNEENLETLLYFLVPLSVAVETPKGLEMFSNNSLLVDLFVLHLKTCLTNVLVSEDQIKATLKIVEKIMTEATMVDLEPIDEMFAALVRKISENFNAPNDDQVESIRLWLAGCVEIILQLSKAQQTKLIDNRVVQSINMLQERVVDPLQADHLDRLHQKLSQVVFN